MSVLEVPVDHRLRDIIRELMKLNEAPTASNLSSNHNDNLRQLCRSRRRRGWSISENEVDFACYLAEPAIRGGIVVALMQPPSNQDYSLPFEEVVNDCNTLLALRDLAEFFNLPFDRLSIFDAYLFITNKKLNQENVDHSESHTTFHDMIVEKQPTVVLTGWTSPSFWDFTTKALRKRAIGAVFRIPTIHYSGLTFSMVNMPHPSYYMNYYPTESCFRQLQILEFAQACGRWWGAWQEEAWMAELREKCKARAKFLFHNKVSVTERLTETLTRLRPVLAEMHYSFSSKAQIGEHLSENNISERCTDVSLILRHYDAISCDTERVKWAKASMKFLCTWPKRRWPTLRKPSVPTTAGLRGIFDHGCFDRIPLVDLPPLARQIESCLMSFAKKMNLSWTSGGDGYFAADFVAQSSACFQLAKGIEDAMDEIPDNSRILGKSRDELVTALEALDL